MLKKLSPLYSSFLAFTVGFFVCLISFNHWQNKSSDLEITLNGPDTAAVGEILEYDASITNKPSGINEVLFQWEVLRDGKETVLRSMSNNSVLFGSGSKGGRALILLNGVIVRKHFFFLTEVSPIKPIIKEVVIGDNPNPDPTPNPGPNPNPGPTPNVTPVDGKYKIAVLAYNTAMSKVSSSKRAELFQAVSKNYLAVAEQVSQGKLATVQQVFSALKALNGPLFAGAYSDVIEQYKQYDQILQQYIYKLFTDKVLGGVPDYALLFTEIASGLGCVK